MRDEERYSIVYRTKHNEDSGYGSDSRLGFAYNQFKRINLTCFDELSDPSQPFDHIPPLLKIVTSPISSVYYFFSADLFYKKPIDSNKIDKLDDLK